MSAGPGGGQVVSSSSSSRIRGVVSEGTYSANVRDGMEIKMRTFNLFIGLHSFIRSFFTILLGGRQLVGCCCYE